MTPRDKSPYISGKETCLSTILFRKPLLLLMFTALSLFSNSQVSYSYQQPANPPSLQAQYKQAKFFYKQLESDKELGKQRSLWIKSSSNFRKVYLNNPKSELAPASLFMQGKIYQQMYQHFSRMSDLNESIDYFQDCIKLFPHHRLADDALLKLAEIYYKEKNNPEKAAEFYRTILLKYPMGDMHPEAADRLKTLSSKYNIALPELMLDDIQHAKLTSVLPVKYWSSEDYSRIIIKASGPVTYSAQLLEKNNNAPRRLFVDFKNSYIEPRHRKPIPIADGLLKQIRSGQHSKDTVRVVLDIESISQYKIFSLPDPFRVVIDIRGTKQQTAKTPAEKRVASIDKVKVTQKDIIVLKENRKHKPKSRTTATARKKSVLPQDRTTYTLAQQLGLGVRKIVIDPGHGGKDSGATGNGLKEKDIVLDLAKRLETILERDGKYEIVLTRDTDKYISLEERTAIANGNDADLFISLHINAHTAETANGLETYYLNLSNDPDEMRVAAFENATSELQLSDLQEVLANIMQNSKVNESSRLAQSIHTSLVSGLNDHHMHLRDLGVKRAPFYVLIGAEMPSILLELGFVSNEEDSQKLKREEFLQTSAELISSGIHNYIASIISQVNR